MSETNVELARRGFEAVLRGDLDVIAEMLDPDVKWHAGDPSAEGTCQNRNQALTWMRRAQTEKGPVGELIDVVGVGDKVVVIARPRSRGGDPGPPVANVTTFRDGRVVEMVHYDDPEEALAAVRG